MFKNQLTKTEFIKDGENWYVSVRLKDEDENNPTGIHQIFKQGKTKNEARELLSATLS